MAFYTLPAGTGSGDAGAGTRAPQVGEDRERERRDDEQQREGERTGQAEFLERDEDLVRQPARVVSDDDHGPERAHGPRPRCRKTGRQPGS